MKSNFHHNVPQTFVTYDLSFTLGYDTFVSAAV